MTIPSIGGARGIFEIFIPGLFFLLNLVAFLDITIYISPTDLYKELNNNLWLSIVVFICFGYLIGILLRLFKTDIPDSLSAKFIRTYCVNARVSRILKDDLPEGTEAIWEELKEKKYIKKKKDGSLKITKKVRRDYLKKMDFNLALDDIDQANQIKKVFTDKLEEILFAVEKFPYIKWIEKVCSLYLPQDVKIFYDKYWKSRYHSRGNKQFFNYCKTMINSTNKDAMNEIFAAQALSRYIAEMFFALLLSIVLMVLAFFIRIVFLKLFIPAIIIILLSGYLLALLLILRHYRFIRIKEVETVFASSFRFKEIFTDKNNED